MQSRCIHPTVTHHQCYNISWRKSFHWLSTKFVWGKLSILCVATNENIILSLKSLPLVLQWQPPSWRWASPPSRRGEHHHSSPSLPRIHDNKPHPSLLFLYRCYHCLCSPVVYALLSIALCDEKKKIQQLCKLLYFAINNYMYQGGCLKAVKIKRFHKQKLLWIVALELNIGPSKVLQREVVLLLNRN